jgi:hypothetical protein
MREGEARTKFPCANADKYWRNGCFWPEYRFHSSAYINRIGSKVLAGFVVFISPKFYPESNSVFSQGLGFFAFTGMNELAQSRSAHGRQNITELETLEQVLADTE